MAKNNTPVKAKKPEAPTPAKMPNGETGLVRALPGADPAMNPMCEVYQTNVTGKDKEYHIAGKDMDATQYGLHAHEPCKMPLRHALYFLPHDVFKVIGPDGRQMRFDITPADSESDGLPAHKVVAGLEELTLDALVARATRMPNGRKANRNWGKEALIRFILDGRQISLNGRRLVAGPAGEESPRYTEEGGDIDEDVALEEDGEDGDPAATDGDVDPFVAETQRMPEHLARVNQNNQR